MSGVDRLRERAAQDVRAGRKQFMARLEEDLVATTTQRGSCVIFGFSYAEMNPTVEQQIVLRDSSLSTTEAALRIGWTKGLVTNWRDSRGIRSAPKSVLWEPWEKKLLSRGDLSNEEIARATGRTKTAVISHRSKMRRLGEL